MLSTPSSSQSMQTKSKILSAALNLLNDQSYHAVSTHDIAREAHISPGNLYYHFRNKEEIVCELFQQIEIFSEQKWCERGPHNPKESFLDFMRFFFGNLERYRFFFRDFSIILDAVPAMQDLWKLRYRKLLKTMREAVSLWTKAGILKKFDTAKDVEYFIETCWVLANFSSVHYERTFDVHGPGLHKHQTQLILRFLYPYHTPKGQRALELYLK